MTVENKKKLGAYYTPKNVTDTLSKWAIRDSNDKILEPSFGGCNFLISSIRILEKRLAKKPEYQIFGFDIDSSAFETLAKNKIGLSNFYCEDFLLTDKNQKVNVILGNPPFLPIHKVEEKYRNKIYSQFSKSEFKIPRRSSLWVYFIYKSLNHLIVGGRMAWVVPDSLSFTNYGKSFLEFLCLKFSSVEVIRVDERYFTETGTKEKTSFLLCENFGGNCSSFKEQSFKMVQEALNYVLSDKTSLIIEPKSLKENKIKNNFENKKLNEVFFIKIGIVIGATKYLVLNEQKAKKSTFYPNYLYPIISKGKQLEDGVHTYKEKLIKTSSISPIYLINGVKIELENPDLFQNLIHSIPEKILMNETFKKRNKLFGYDDFAHPDAFLTFYSQGLPRFVVNKNKELNCTNSVHRLYSKIPIDIEILYFIALQFYTNIFPYDINSHARHYGNSIFKFEPSDAGKIQIIYPKNIDSELSKQIHQWVLQIENNLKDDKTEIKEKIRLELLNLIY